MEEEGIGMVLARATELRLKISNCILKSSSTSSTVKNDFPDSVNVDPSRENRNGVEGAEEGEDEEAERLFSICDTFESLETQLSALQALQQQQQYEHEAALAEIEQSRRMLLDKLKDYKGEEHVEVINEASSFAGEKVSHNHDLILPPYPSFPPHSIRLHHHIGYFQKFSETEAKKDLMESIRTQNSQRGSKHSRNGVGPLISAAAKMVITIVGVVSILGVAGFGRNFGKRGNFFKGLSHFQQPRNDEEKKGTINIECPHGKVLVVEDGEARCLVKERIEVPFSSVVGKPDVNYGCG